MNTIDLPKFAVLCGIGYNITVHEGLIVFEEAQCIFGHHTRLAFERTDDPGGGIWYLNLSSTYQRVSVSHIVAAYELIIRSYGKNFEEKQKL